MKRRDRVNPSLVNDLRFCERVAAKAQAVGLTIPYLLLAQILLKIFLALAKRRHDQAANIIRAFNAPTSSNEADAWIDLRRNLRDGLPTATSDQIEQILDIAKKEALEQAARQRGN